MFNCSFFRSLRLIFITLLFVCSPPLFAKVAEVLVLHSGHQGNQWTRDIQDGIEEQFEDENIALYVTYLDSYQVLSEQALAQYVDYFARKFEQRDFDAVIVSGDNALKLVQRYADRLFLNTPIIFTGIKRNKKSLLNFTHKISGVIESENILGTVLLSLSLFPETHSLFIVTGNSRESKITTKSIAKFSKQLSQNVITFNDETEVSLKQKVSKLTANSVLIFDDFSRDRNGQFVNRSTMLKSLIGVSKAPIFVVNQHDLEDGVLGGLVISGVTQGKTAAIKVLDLLQGVPIEALPVEVNVSDKYYFQYEEMLRWNIKESDVPSNSIILNVPVTNFHFTDSFTIALLSCLLMIIFALIQWWKVHKVKLEKAEVKRKSDNIEHIFNVSYDFIFILDLLGNIRNVNQTALNAIDQEIAEMKGTPLWDARWLANDLESQQRLKSAMGVARLGNQIRFECMLLDKVGERHAFDLSIQPIREGDEDSEITSIIVEGRNINEIKSVEEEVRKANKRSNLLLDESPSMLLMLNAQGLILSCNKYGCNLLGYDDGELIGRNLVTLYSQLVNISDLKEYLEHCNSADGMLLSREISYSTKEGRKVWINERVRKLAEHDQYFLVCENITERYELSKELNYRASHDYLTGLKNRLFFENQLDKYLKDLAYQSAPYSLMYLDMDKFKIINDTCGHQAGDEVLRQIAAILTESVSAHSLVARLGGDEFAIIMPQTELVEAKQAAQRIIDAIGKHYFLWEGQHFSLGISIGLAELSDAGRGGVHALSCVDSACYTAKESGRNRIHIYEEDKQEELRREEVVWVNKVQDALRDESRFCLYAQLIKPVDGDSEYLHYEILTRMIDEAGNLASPDKFIPIAESYNLADKIDMIIITKTLSWLRNHPEHVSKLDMCSINLSGQSVGDPQFIDDLVELLNGSALPLQKLCFEITETVAIGSFSNASKLIRALKKLGCKLALDDFGTGLSSFGYLKRLHVDYLKIDGVFVKDMANDEQDFGIVKSIHELSHLFGKKTIAEYVEDEVIIEKLKEIGVDYAQGYHLGKPVPIDMMALLSDSMSE
ncbi:hypothetical protein CW745_06965 [Psychromonas sp. psych-6C06]|uniref:ABC transporter substrate binding protein n=1 Tax=Psychromonas sp. psych-6C06 TaxID=2058089 RepID=UPI000C343A3D|nr:ABC transporter substrate binding protein [Psychromonas sp. psych-6C06]PKF62296.1 hypothetical protein CW745_06965 [Psychromonas sp. psych-6C06]